MEPKTCQLTLRNLKSNQIGDWKCRVVHANCSRFQEAHITVTPDGISMTVRLPQHLKPQKYNVYLTPFIVVDNFTVQGHVDISIIVKDEISNNITLHIDRIKVYENLVKVTGLDGSEKEIEGFAYDEARHFFIILLKENLPQGENITLSIDFLSQLTTDTSGFYRSSYFDKEQNHTDYIATTQFQAVGARRALPCFDEPAFKAVFQANLGRLTDMHSISNMPAKQEGIPMKDNDIYVWDVYQDTPYMSSYLLAFVISRYVYKEGDTSSSGVQFKIWSRKSVSEQTLLIAELGPKILNFYDHHFNIPYPLPKIDMAAIQNFGANGMENWGLITFLEPFILYSEEKSSVADKERIAHITAHELAHQWFGNLVTMEWWTE
jgi:aminopeptidase N